MALKKRREKQENVLLESAAEVEENENLKSTSPNKEKTEPLEPVCQSTPGNRLIKSPKLQISSITIPVAPKLLELTVSPRAPSASNSLPDGSHELVLLVSKIL